MSVYNLGEKLRELKIVPNKKYINIFRKVWNGGLKEILEQQAKYNSHCNVDLSADFRNCECDEELFCYTINYAFKLHVTFREDWKVTFCWNDNSLIKVENPIDENLVDENPVDENPVDEFADWLIENDYHPHNGDFLCESNGSQFTYESVISAFYHSKYHINITDDELYLKVCENFDKEKINNSTIQKNKSLDLEAKNPNKEKKNKSLDLEVKNPNKEVKNHNIFVTKFIEWLVENNYHPYEGDFLLKYHEGHKIGCTACKKDFRTVFGYFCHDKNLQLYDDMTYVELYAKVYERKYQVHNEKLNDI